VCAWREMPNSFHHAMGERRTTSRRVSRIQRRTSCMRAVRRRDQLSPRSNARWKNPLPRMCRRELLRAVVKCPAFLAATPEDHVKLHVSLRGARTDHTATHGSRRGLHSCAAARLPTRGPLHSRMSVSRLMQKGPATCHKTKSPSARPMAILKSTTRKTQCAFASTPTCACASARGRRTITGCDVVVWTVWRESW
jgi:hypothetical protein